MFNNDNLKSHIQLDTNAAFIYVPEDIAGNVRIGEVERGGGRGMKLVSGPNEPKKGPNNPLSRGSNERKLVR